ncbi:tRNA (adenosine(37)-N6)-threonylcarbamoyltransferase complex dimerization subunit type 1 TsaB [Gilvimarinus agarilyticus]|uniref:tRNA (adenosine(37)-N6)-threonylcarbamoyltransferase complex dimerization subunit type 1 TsaB n=1 Tax=Reichenbachiella agariperforans TaxID=156994 RepID=UPI001C0A60EB|nr:tRNA (adenosine(37)-N6)-threonylcarbamoyltransferase complex dimerization subunit type 1 TsaB [Reichenbachiella agariperforans]MBU2885904.1 tRNA (adenosine(37)-N6)-threonylcarbamoyltransferase complex dimerization subunit type 1 TsaB [Gilvimarinus agarilyticus]MBU2915287.1 tRNA (adenosine(37)-N6)-threonylcarbamoyltransferase complex dimerization subunit type 1 TsaB [Reichenbachiella agariperforans]
MSTILSIDTSTKSGSVALICAGLVVGAQHYNIDKSHSSLLHVMIDELMKNTGTTLEELDAIAISEGPGSYTGLRIGVSAAKGLCYALELPLIAVNTLEAMAYQVYRYSSQVDYLCPMIDARRMEVYALVKNGNFETVQETEPVIVDEESFVTELADHQVVFFGDGAAKCQEVIQHPNASFVSEVYPSAVEVGLLGAKKYELGQFENVIDFEPFYLKEFRLATAKTSKK